MIQELLPGPTEAVLAVVAAWAITYTLHSTFFLGLAWLLDGRTPLTRGAAARSTLWKAAVAAGVVTTSLQVATGTGPGLEVEIAESEKVIAELGAGTSSDVSTGTGVASAAGERGPGPEEPGGASRGHGSDGAGERAGPAWTSGHEAALEADVWLHALEHAWPLLIGLFALVGAGLGLGAQTLLWARLARRLSGRTRLRDGPLVEALEEARRASNSHGRVVLSRSDDLPGPVALPWGEICVPASVTRSMDRETQKAVLAHELAHLDRGDPRLLLALSLLERVLFFQPLNRLARRRLNALSETISDDRVRRLGLGPALADGLVTVAERLRNRGRGAAVAGLASTSGIGRRVTRLLEPGPEPPRLVPGWAGALAAGGLLAIGVVAGPSLTLDFTDHRAHVDAPAGPGAPGATTAVAVTSARELRRLRGPDGPTGGADTAETAALDPRLATLLERDGGTAHLRLTEAAWPVRITLRPSQSALRLTLPDGRTLEPARPEASSGPLFVLQVRDAAPGDYVLHAPPSLEALAVEVNGRFVTGDMPAGGDELPAIVTPGPADG